VRGRLGRHGVSTRTPSVWWLLMASSSRHLRRARALLLTLSSVSVSLLVAARAHAQSTIREPGQRPHYVFELEPHLLVTPFDAPDYPSDGGYGIGVRGTIEILPDGFIPKLNDSVGIGFGLDWVHYDLAPYGGGCRRFEPTADNVPVCVDAGGGGGSASYWYVPVVMQWNFWLHPRWSVFGEPGLAISHGAAAGFSVAPDIAVGGRFHASDSVALTLRLGYPAVTFGVSFLL
jgi:hypothetical protein